MLYKVLHKLFFIPVVGWILRPKLLHGERIPKQGAAILAANHISWGDTFSLPTLMKRPLRFAAKRELFEMRGIKALLGTFLRIAGQVPLDRSGGSSGEHGLESLLAVLQRGELLGIFPEGTRSPDGRLYRCHTGVARLALLSGVPVIPVGMVNTHVRRALIFPTMRQARIIVGQPIDFSAYAEHANDSKVLRWVSDEIARHIQQLTKQTYVDVYGARIKYGSMSLQESQQFVKEYPNVGVPSPVACPVGVASVPKEVLAGSAPAECSSVAADISEKIWMDSTAHTQLTATSTNLPETSVAEELQP
ncbi:MAG: 1-acyl-sn-glycerol-3-phosphate acyltransferase [Propionibacteriaceae bacterium]|jgi:1-acyl-sn-glycerol-3-phosphate acyltransferase|nr:1-acyl-sn-glycerol-3-phosphate acyltransferase [Propionibacteriaceae bacterium]